MRTEAESLEWPATARFHRGSSMLVQTAVHRVSWTGRFEGELHEPSGLLIRWEAGSRCLASTPHTLVER